MCSSGSTRAIRRGEILNHTNICSTINSIPSPSKYEDTTFQNLGLLVSLSPDESKLLVCAPRFRHEINFCAMSSKNVINTRGRCYEILAGGGIQSEISYCDRTNWQEVGSGVTLEYGDTTTACVQLRHSGTSQGKVEVVGNSVTRTLTITFDIAAGTFVAAYDYNSQSGSGSCHQDNLVLDITKYYMIVYCKREYSFALQTGLTDVRKIKIQNFQSAWIEFYTGISSKDKAKEYSASNTCLLGVEGGYNAEGRITLTAPGYKLDDSGMLYEGAVWREGTMEMDRGENSSITSLGLASYHSILFSGVLYEATSGSVNIKLCVSGRLQTSDILGGTVSIQKLGTILVTLTSPNQFDGFGSALLFWKHANTILELLISAPSTKVGSVLDCGVVHVYRLSAGGSFEHNRIVSGICGMFGATLANIQDQDGNGYSDIAVASPFSSSVSIYLATEEGIADTTVQVITENIESFGLDIAVTSSQIAISGIDFISIYSFLPVTSLIPEVTCPASYNLDGASTAFTCSVCLSHSEQSTAANITVSWLSRHANITASETQFVSIITNVVKCRNVTFDRYVTAREFDMSPINITFSFRHHPIPSHREVAFVPGSLVSIDRVIQPVGVCGKDVCEADYTVDLTWTVTREEGGSFVAPNNTTLYLGSGSETLHFTVTVQVKTGAFINDFLNFDLPFTSLQRNMSNCSEAITTDSYAVSLSDGCEGPCTSNPSISWCEITSTTTNQMEMVLNLPLPNAAFGYGERVNFTVTLTSQRSKELNPADNTLQFEIPTLKLSTITTTSSFEPDRMTGLISSGYKSSSTTLYGLGPSQSLDLTLNNIDSPMVGSIEVNIMYPVIYRGKEVIYLSNITGPDTGDFSCTRGTEETLNYRNLQNEFLEISNGTQHSSLPVVDCQEDDQDWECVNLTCEVRNLKSGGSNSRIISVETQVDVEQAASFVNLTLVVQYTSRIVDVTSYNNGEMKAGSITTVVGVRPATTSIFLAVVGAVFGGSALLALLVVVLARAGVFKRKTRSEMLLEVNEIYTNHRAQGYESGGDGRSMDQVPSLPPPLPPTCTKSPHYSEEEEDEQIYDNHEVKDHSGFRNQQSV
eukprot:sb/3461401/